jgi:hypothetical protein
MRSITFCFASELFISLKWVLPFFRHQGYFVEIVNLAKFVRQDAAIVAQNSRNLSERVACIRLDVQSMIIFVSKLVRKIAGFDLSCICLGNNKLKIQLTIFKRKAGSKVHTPYCMYGTRTGTA